MQIQMVLQVFNNWLEMQHFFITQRMKQKKAAMHSKKNANRTSVNSLVSLNHAKAQPCLNDKQKLPIIGSFF